MPVKRRRDKMRPKLPEAIELLIAGQPIEYSPEAHSAILGLIYFHEYGEVELTAEQKDVAHELLGEWAYRR